MKISGVDLTVSKVANVERFDAYSEDTFIGSMVASSGVFRVYDTSEKMVFMATIPSGSLDNEKERLMFLRLGVDYLTME